MLQRKCCEIFHTFCITKKDKKPQHSRKQYKNLLEHVQQRLVEYKKSICKCLMQ